MKILQIFCSILSLIIAQVILPLVTPDSPEVKIGNMSFKNDNMLWFDK